ncbi:MAG: hypothetical protein K6E81_05480 [Lachnospiraceae bacterium]|nr:hypothetical protein [Lachnospiraceae bacterium]
MVIFLDVDGVLNRQSDWQMRYYLREECVRNLSELYQRLHCEGIVLSSTWRAGVDKDFNGDPLSEKLREYSMRILGATPLSNKTRAEEIQFYARRHDLTRYLILDDDESLFGNAAKLPLYLVNYRTGLTAEDVKKAERFFRKVY